MKMRERMPAQDHIGSVIATDRTFTTLRSGKTATSSADQSDDSKATGEQTSRAKPGSRRLRLSYFNEALTAA